MSKVLPSFTPTGYVTRSAPSQRHRETSGLPSILQMAWPSAKPSKAQTLLLSRTYPSIWIWTSVPRLPLMTLAIVTRQMPESPLQSDSSNLLQTSLKLANRPLSRSPSSGRPVRPPTPPHQLKSSCCSLLLSRTRRLLANASVTKETEAQNLWLPPKVSHILLHPFPPAHNKPVKLYWFSCLCSCMWVTRIATDMTTRLSLANKKD
ncbi:PREDICTED: uncharacterized protein LOC106932996 isoform X2 [Poecilia mexicana]|uniref:uncharacterized protein LOC106932996 isoform X2 n=1 Tax=Poecilia mexicana TaxID=48701 RepID=UPI00072DD7DC|nr:PREDICTED: uncharacterized protein LOC106932996 isoform X2 [Poecilia mexicana]